MIAIFFIFVFGVFFMYYYYERIHYYNVQMVKSDINSKSYLVRDMPDKQNAANMLAKIDMNMKKLSDYLYKNKKKFPKHIKHIEQLNTKLKKSKIQESTDNGLYTSYSVNKGEQLVFCLRSRENNSDKLHDLNLLMYVVLHEMSHVACPEFGHTDLFKDIFEFIAQQAVEIGIYKKIDFNNDNREYCGLTITDSII